VLNAVWLFKSFGLLLVMGFSQSRDGIIKAPLGAGLGDAMGAK